MRSHLLDGTVRHRRLRPFHYELRHGVYYVALDLDEIEQVSRAHRLISRNRSNVLAFFDRDHFDPPAGDVAAEMRAHLRSEGLDPKGWRITLVTNLRVLGYVFNPASFYLCRDAAGELRMVVVEVHNTHGERHLYTLWPERRNATHQATMAKEFYVSPFLDIEGGYVVRVHDHPAGLRIAIDHHADGQPLLLTSLALRRQPLSDRRLLRMLLRYPLVTLRTIALIHWHAFHLWRRGAGFRPHRAKRSVTGPRSVAAKS